MQSGWEWKIKMMQMIGHSLARELGRYSNFEWSRVIEDGCRFMRMARLYVVIIKLGMTLCPDRRMFDYAPHKNGSLLHLRWRVFYELLGDKGKRGATRGPSTATATATTMTMTVEIDANSRRVRDEFRIMFLVYDRARRHAS